MTSLGQQEEMQKTLSHPWTINHSLMTDPHPPWMNLNLSSITIPQLQRREVQGRPLREKQLRDSVNLVWTLQEDARLWGKTLVKLLVKLPKSLSSKG